MISAIGWVFAVGFIYDLFFKDDNSGDFVIYLILAIACITLGR